MNALCNNVFINARPISLLFWQVSSIVGICLIIIGVGAGYVDVATHFEFEFLSNHFGIFLIGALLGTLSAFIGVIGWAKHLKPGTRARVAGLVFAAPWIGGLLGYPIEGFNIHGPSALLLLMIVPASILALVLVIMAGY